MNRERVVVICPGRGSYSRETTRYINNHYNINVSSYLTLFDKKRKEDGRLKITELDSMNFKSNIHMVGENASPLIYACSLNDFLSIDQAKYEIVAITGNSMGWYSALAFSEAVSLENGYELINTMGSMMENKIIGGQLIYPIVNEDWVIDKKIKQKVFDEINKAEAHISIILGGYVVVGGSEKSLKTLLKRLPPIENYPFLIPYHAAFHTSLMHQISSKGFKKIPGSFFLKPKIPIIDGRGFIWSPYGTDTQELYKYTFGSQVTEAFSFTKSITSALKEFCPDRLIALGPGNSLGGPIGQIIIKNKWNSLLKKKSFIAEQEKDPFLISMGILEQREIVSL